jgi:hypothetical protein
MSVGLGQTTLSIVSLKPVLLCITSELKLIRSTIKSNLHKLYYIKMIIKLYRKFISQRIRDKIYDFFLGDFLLFIRNFKENSKAKYKYLFQWILPDTTENRLYAFMGRNGLTPYPYPFMLEYKYRSIECLLDDKTGLQYVIHCGKKLYYPKSFNKTEIITNYRDLLTEQDARSPHQYLQEPSRLSGKIVLDIGTAEGIFSLTHIELIDHAYLFECDEKWIEALNVTFTPWKEKVTIIPRYVSDKNDESNITIDSFLAMEKIRNPHLFIKMDIEGYEQAALRGASNTLKRIVAQPVDLHRVINNEVLERFWDIDFSICTYHTKNAVNEISEILKSYKFEYEQTDGFLYYGKEFRKAIIRRKI